MAKLIISIYTWELTYLLKKEIGEMYYKEFGEYNDERINDLIQWWYKYKIHDLHLCLLESDIRNEIAIDSKFKCKLLNELHKVYDSLLYRMFRLPPWLYVYNVQKMTVNSEDVILQYGEKEKEMMDARNTADRSNVSRYIPRGKEILSPLRFELHNNRRRH